MGIARTEELVEVVWWLKSWELSQAPTASGILILHLNWSRLWCYG